MDLEEREDNERHETTENTRGEMEEAVQFSNLTSEKTPRYHLCSATTAALMGQPVNSKMKMKLQYSVALGQ